MCSLCDLAQVTSILWALVSQVGGDNLQHLLYRIVLQIIWECVVFQVKNLPASVGDTWDAGLTPRLRRSPREGHGNPLQYSCLENPIDRGAWQVQSLGSQRVRRAWINLASMHTWDCVMHSKPPPLSWHHHHFPATGMPHASPLCA